MTGSPQALAALGMAPSLAGKIGIDPPVTLAATGQTQADAAQVSAPLTYVFPVDPTGGNTSVRLPKVSTAPHDEYIVCNGGTDPGDTLSIFPAVGDEIAGLGATPVQLSTGYGGMGARFRKLDATRWLAI